MLELKFKVPLYAWKRPSLDVKDMGSWLRFFGDKSCYFESFISALSYGFNAISSASGLWTIKLLKHDILITYKTEDDAVHVPDLVAGCVDELFSVVQSIVVDGDELTFNKDAINTKRVIMVYDSTANVREAAV